MARSAIIYRMPHNISYTNIASILLKEINRVRNDPQLLVPVLEERVAKYDEDGNYFPLPGLNFSVKTRDGTQGVLNLIQFLRKQRQCGSLHWSYELHQAADKRGHFLSSSQEKNVFNRVANLQIGELVSQFTTWKGHLVELTFYGFIEPREFLCELLLEDGREEKENRVEFFNRVSCFAGIGINTHEKYRFVIVVILAMQVANHEAYSYKTIEEAQSLPPSMKQFEQQQRNTEKQFEDAQGQGVEEQGQVQADWREGDRAEPAEVALECKLDDCEIY